MLDGFAQTAAGFAQGTKGLIDLMKNMDKTAKVREQHVSTFPVISPRRIVAN